MTIDDWRARYDHLNAETGRLRAEVERLREDAARARWCEEMKAAVGWNRWTYSWDVLWYDRAKVFRQAWHPDRNAAIDAARGVK